jgi:hypothetical protein
MTTRESAIEFEAKGARRLLVIGGIALTVAGMIFGDVFAVFVLHQDANRIGKALIAVTDAVAAKDSVGVVANFTDIGGLLENRGTKVDTHVHVIDFGYLALLLALIQPYVAFAKRARRRLAVVFMVGATMLPVSVFLIHYVGLARSPLTTIGWASIFADTGGLLVIIACLGELAGLWRYVRGSRDAFPEELSLKDRSWASRALLTGGTLLVFAGFLQGARYAIADLSKDEANDREVLEQMLDRSAIAQNQIDKDMMFAHRSVETYGTLQAGKAVKIAAHSHTIEFGLLAILMAFAQQYVFLSERWARRWVIVMLSGSVMLPVFVLLEAQYPKWVRLIGGTADLGGLMVVIALIGMLVGVLRYNRQLDSGKGTGA